MTASDAAGSDNFGYSVALDMDTALIGAQLNDTAGGNNAGSAYVFVRSSSVWNQQAQILAPDGAADDQFGFSVAVSSNTAVIGAPLDDTTAGINMGNAHIFERVGSVWAWQSQLTSSRTGGPAGDRFGSQVCISEDTIVVGAPNDDTSGGGDAGSAIVFAKVTSAWTEQAVLLASDGLDFDFFGTGLAFDGETIIVGAYADNTEAGANGGSAYVYQRVGLVWNEQAHLSNGNGASTDGFYGDLFGGSLDIENNTAVIGAQYADTLAGANSGEVYVFICSESVWLLQASLMGSDVSSGDEFSGVAISGDTIVAAARFWGSNQGAAYVFVRSGEVWNQQTKLTADDASSGDAFGFRLDIDQNTIVIGTGVDDTAAGIDAGSVYVFTRSSGAWQQQAHLFASDGNAGDNFGICRISGETLIVGARNADTGNGADAGKVYVFTRQGSSWFEDAIVTAQDGAASDFFGTSLSIFGDLLIISAPGQDVVGSDSGAVYSFGRTGSAWSQESKIVPADAASGDQFGASLDYASGYLIVGAPTDNSSAGADTGSAYVFARAGYGWVETSKILAPDASSGDYFGSNVAMHGDTVLIYSFLDDTELSTFLPGYIVSNHGSVYIFRLNDSEIAVEHPSGINLTDAGMDLTFGGFRFGTSNLAKTFTVSNLGSTNLHSLIVTKGGTHASEISLNTSSLGSSIVPGGSATFTVSFVPNSPGIKDATIQIYSNDMDESPFDISLTGNAYYSSTDDYDGDGMNDWQEVQLSSLGFDWQSANTEMVNTYFSTASQNGLYTTTQVQDLNVGIPLIQRNATTGEFTLTFGVEKSENLGGWNIFPMSVPQTTINAQGRLEFRFTVPDNAAFFRLRAE